MPTIVTVTGQGGMQMGSTNTPIGVYAGSVPPELHGNQWGVLRLDLGSKPQERT